jgi:hypothetical protein
VVSFASLPLYPRGKSPRYPLDRRLGGPHSRSGRFGEEKILDPTGIRTPTPRSSSTVANRYTAYLWKFSYKVISRNWICIWRCYSHGYAANILTRVPHK